MTLISDPFIGTKIATKYGNTYTVVDQTEFYTNPTTNLRTKLYSITCDICHQDRELWPEPILIRKGQLLRNSIPCGCNKRVTHWSEDQYIILCQRRCNELGSTFLGWANDYNGEETKVIRVLRDGSTHSNTDIHSLLRYHARIAL